MPRKFATSPRVVIRFGAVTLILGTVVGVGVGVGAGADDEAGVGAGVDVGVGVIAVEIWTEPRSVGPAAGRASPR